MDAEVAGDVKADERVGVGNSSALLLLKMGVVVALVVDLFGTVLAGMARD
jgi:hypothetical protein